MSEHSVVCGESLKYFAQCEKCGVIAMHATLVGIETLAREHIRLHGESVEARVDLSRGRK